MPANFLDLPGELRNKIYNLSLSERQLVFLWRHVPRRVNPPLLQTSSKIRREASAVFYSQNCFGFAMVSDKRIDSFLELIGQENADRIRHIYIEFPISHRNMNTGHRLPWAWVGMIANIQFRCPNLETIMMRQMRDNSTWGWDNSGFIRACAEIDMLLRKILFLQEVVVEVSGEGLRPPVRKAMQDYGWIILDVKWPGSCFKGAGH